MKKDPHPLAEGSTRINIWKYILKLNDIFYLPYKEQDDGFTKGYILRLLKN